MESQGGQVEQSDLRSEGTRWSKQQQEVIEAPVRGRLLVDAGPGTGKTATACARIAWLIANGGVDASEIWLFSFTRTAVHELRNRISSYLVDPGAVASLKIATVDAHAWAIHSGFDSRASLSGSFDDNIERVIELVRSHEGVFSYLASLRHLIVDEAQDIVGARCELLLEIIHVLPESAGVTVLSDDAQAIYGFAEESSARAVRGTLPEKIREFLGEQFRSLDLTEVHRTRDSALLTVFRGGRSLIRDKGLSGEAKLNAVRELVGHTNHGSLGAYWEDIKAAPPSAADTLLLFRRRGEALSASSGMGVQPHRLRMSGLPTCIHGWISVLLWDWTKTDLDDSDFRDLWAQRIGADSHAYAAAAWTILVKFFGRSASRISMARLVTKLASGSPTYELSTPEFGAQGPIFSTIHGSKGREAAHVRLYLPGVSTHEDTEESQFDEEARIVFVGATRARNELRVGKAKSISPSRRLDGSGRAFTPYPFDHGKKAARAAVEVGRASDVDPVGLVGRSLYETPSAAAAAQGRLFGLASGMVWAQATSTDKDHSWRYSLESGPDGGHLCYLNPTLGHDLFSIAKFVDQVVGMGKIRPPRQIRNLRVFGLRTVAVAADDPLREQLHAPWRDSGIIAAPMLAGYSMAYFR
jgi:hypothetical protein